MSWTIWITLGVALLARDRSRLQSHRVQRETDQASTER
jgi:hypothetical protein